MEEKIAGLKAVREENRKKNNPELFTEQYLN